MGGYGKAFLDRMPSDVPIQPRSDADINQPPLLRSQTGISGGVFHRIQHVVFGLDYFNAQYGFDPRFVDQNLADTTPGFYVNSEQTVHIVNGGVTLEW